MQDGDIVALIFTLGIVLLAVLIAAVAVLFDYFPYRRKSLRHSLLIANQLLVRYQFAEAEKLLCKLAEKYPDQIGVPFLRSICFIHLGAYQNADSCLDEVACLNKNPKVKKSFILRAYLKQQPGLHGLPYNDAVETGFLKLALMQVAEHITRLVNISRHFKLPNK